MGGGEKDSIKGDGLVVYDSTGKLVWKWNIFDHEDPLSYKNINSLKNDWTHGNGIGVTFDNNYVLSLRTLNQLWKIDSKSGKILWKLGLNGNISIEESSIFYAQHAIHEIGVDTFLLFDNGTRKERMISRALIFSMRDNQFKLLNSNMSLEEFKVIFYWEYFHRVLGRVIGLFFLLPFLYFFILNKIDKKFFKPCLTVLFLILLQGFVK